MTQDQKIKVVTPHAYVVIFNYADRLSGIDDKTTERDLSLSQLFINTTSLVSVSTTKPKSTPSGSFEFTLAPTRNWLAKITPGSWCTILMTRDDPIREVTTKNYYKNIGTADKSSFKMFGRIDTVSLDVNVDPSTGARTTSYTVRGRDWGSVFDTTLYVDPLWKTSFDTKGVTMQNLILGNQSNGGPMRKTTELVKSIIQFWGKPVSALNDSSGILKELNSAAQFVLPRRAAEFMQTGGQKEFSSIIEVVGGKLNGYNKYKDIAESVGFIDVTSLFGSHTFWQILNDNCNNTLNELVTDIRWVNGKPKLALYKRIKPFGNRKQLPSDSDGVKSLYSKFRDLERTLIPLEDVLSFNAGTDFNDRVNFVEVTPRYHGLSHSGTQANEDKLNSRIVDPVAYARDGFKPMFTDPLFYATESSSASQQTVSPNAIKPTTDWKYLLREWYFNSHTLLKGTLSFVGQSDYISVGSNIQINSVVLGQAPMNTAADKNEPTYLTAHVEGVDHRFTIEEKTGARRFITTVSFVRGLITDENAVPVGNTFSALDPKDPAGDGRSEPNTVSTSVGYDPDGQKKDGN